VVTHKDKTARKAKKTTDAKYFVQMLIDALYDFAGDFQSENDAERWLVRKFNCSHEQAHRAVNEYQN